MTNKHNTEKWEKTLEYHSHDLGEMGKFIRLEYAKNFIKDAIQSAREEVLNEVIEMVEKQHPHGSMKLSLLTKLKQQL